MEQAQQKLFAVTDSWELSKTNFDPQTRLLEESLTSLGNGYMGMRGTFEEDYSGQTHQGTYIAGVWYPDKTRVGWWKNGYPEYFGKVINATNFSALKITVAGEVLDLTKQPPSDYFLELDLQAGVLRRSYTVNIAGNHLAFRWQRFFSLVQKEIAVFNLEVELLAGPGCEVQISSELQGDIQNQDSNYEEYFWKTKASGITEDKNAYFTNQTKENAFGVPQFVVTTMMKNKTNGTLQTEHFDQAGVQQKYQKTLTTADAKLEFTKYVAVVTDRDYPLENQLSQAQKLLNRFSQNDFSQALQQQAQAWKKRWDKADVAISGDPAAQQGLRFNLFQLFQTYYGEDERLNIGPKGFTGEKYGGATYWDTEAYALPLYLALTEPKVPLQLLKYRHQQLPQAYHNAQQQGLKGALYPMVTFTGVECHNEWEITFEEIHRNGAIAYAIYNYTNYTGDDTYLKTTGLEVLVGIARFWADRVHYVPHKDQYMIHGVTGPNEYENNVNNNWYTNYLARWVLQYTKEMYCKYAASSPITVDQQELADWQQIIDKMYLPYSADLGIFVQHDTFLDKELKPVTELSEKDLPLNQNWSWDKILRSCYIKQADVLQGLYFFNDQFSQAEKERNYQFYEPLTVHESSLSPCIHAILAAELGLTSKALELYLRTARLDLDNYNHDTEDGLHITSMTGSWLALVHGFAQMKTDHNQLSFAPVIPKQWSGYRFRINYRQRLLKVNVTPTTVQVTLLAGEPLELNVYAEKYLLTLQNEIQVPVHRNEE
ncbi:family 65 glycosyl hydrolase domain-containing protein [Ligilactobacillus ceti]|uniref:YvdK n=1 Tax=Ligilactobacillus ceti DSM 22408 TaxID=1122146 RepID=A0A0R2KHP5_9LACO|nr:family 65 glycosyl hydrolase domain-containing protein [Ligilactobacillus ceti]KRN88878.1 YvdK [Ligilactobacillus ceti DSM 22408]